ncbi:hypothetical protein Hanom_Chr09g00811461 [Helianthus anomalus]
MWEEHWTIVWEDSWQSGENSSPDQAGDLVESSDASSVSVKEFRLMRNSQPFYVTRWVATCCCVGGLLETLLVMLHKLRTNL